MRTGVVSRAITNPNPNPTMTTVWCGEQSNPSKKSVEPLPVVDQFEQQDSVSGAAQIDWGTISG